uniref:Uncharacterized protein n=1 Tax=Anguilla anguilla TaxID=7936 RepID=A0A0E9PDT4_ANGAN
MILSCVPVGLLTMQRERERLGGSAGITVHPLLT